jgi:hypothetical protein
LFCCSVVLFFLDFFRSSLTITFPGKLLSDRGWTRAQRSHKKRNKIGIKPHNCEEGNLWTIMCSQHIRAPDIRRDLSPDHGERQPDHVLKSLSFFLFFSP